MLLMLLLMLDAVAAVESTKSKEKGKKQENLLETKGQFDVHDLATLKSSLPS